MAFTYKDIRRFPGLVQTSGEEPGWQLKAENPIAQLGLRAIGAMAASALVNPETRTGLLTAGWNEDRIMALATGEPLLFTQEEPFDKLEQLISVVVGTDSGLENVAKVFGWNSGNGHKK
jgi:hypothetical protein